jgi:hypothetical protein
MRQITKKMADKFNKNENFKLNNTEIQHKNVFKEATTTMFLHGNMIAQKQNNEIKITNSGWFSNTTKERLNGLLDSIGFDKIYQKNFQWFLADKKWNGNLVKILKNNNWEYIN